MLGEYPECPDNCKTYDNFKPLAETTIVKFGERRNTYYNLQGKKNRGFRSRARLQVAERQLESPTQKEERLQKQARLQAAERQLESPRQKEERLQKQARLQAAEHR